MRRYPYAGDVLPYYAYGVYLVTGEQRIVQLAGCHTIDAYATYGAGILGFKGGMDPHFGNILYFQRPVIFQVADPFFLALTAYRVLEIDRLSNALLYGETACAQCFKLTDILSPRFIIAYQRPYLADVLFFDPEHATADWCT